MTKSDTLFRLKAVQKGKNPLNARVKAGWSRSVPGLNPDRQHFTPCFLLSDEMTSQASREARLLELHQQKVLDQLPCD